MHRSLLALVLVATSAHADVPEGVRAHASRLGGSISVDGRLTEDVWRDAAKHSGFTQRFPKDGVKAELETRFAVLYDDSAIYVGVWADDPEPHKIRRLLTRRDIDSPSDVIAVGIDSYHDRRTAFVFQLNAAGVQRDQILFDDSKEDTTWDAVWTGDAAITAQGWTAEFRIP
ncbi:MAG: carbohydrate binding family 9 domain-containing protein, partial [Kofleriaceae bacterium]